MKILKKGIAMVVAVAMMLTLVSISVFADTTDDSDISIKITADKNKVGQDKTVKITVAVKGLKGEVTPANSGFTLRWEDYTGTIPAENIKITPVKGKAQANVTKLAEKYTVIAIKSTYGTEYTDVLTAEFKIPADATVGNFPLKVTNSKFVDEETGGALKEKFETLPTIQIAKVDKVTSIESSVADQNANLGATKEEIANNLKNVTVKGTNSAGEVTLKTKDWDSNDFVVDQKGDYTFNGTAYSDDDFTPIGENVATAVKAKVSVSGITLTKEMVVQPEAKKYMKSATAAEKTPAEIVAELNADAKYNTLDVKSGNYTGKAKVAWTSVATTNLDLTKVTAETGNETNKVAVTGNVTITDANSNFKIDTAVTITMDVTVVPAEVAGGGLTVKTASKNGYGKVSVTVPKESVVEGKKIVATMTSESFASTVTTPVTAEYTFTADDVTAAEKAGTFTTELKFDKTFGKLGLDTNKKYKVSVTVDGAALLTKDGDKEVKEVEKKVAAQASSGGSSSNPSSPIIVNKYDVKVTAGENGTATAEPTKAAAGDKVTVKAVPAEGFKVKDVVVKDANGNAVEVDAKTHTFTMPKGAVTVEVTFEEGKDKPGVEDGKFTDVPDTFWAAADIYTLKEAGIINGKSDKEFDPEGKVTRAEFTKMIVNLFGVKASQNTVAFTDCKADDWFTPFVAAAVEAGYVKGITDTEFAPDKTITREEACTILGRAYAKTSDKALNFKDASEISDFATAYVALLVDMGYVNGYEDGTFLPKNEITRAEAAKIIASAYRAAKKAKTEVTEDKTKAKDNADADVKADAKTDAKTDAKADAKTDTKADAKTDAKADNGETPKK